MMQEAMRFAPVAATGTTRIARQAMMLGGYLIPKWGAPAIMLMHGNWFSSIFFALLDLKCVTRMYD